MIYCKEKLILIKILIYYQQQQKIDKCIECFAIILTSLFK